MGDIGSTFTGLSGKNKEDFGHGDAQFITYMNVFSNPVANLEMTEAVEIDAKQNSVKKGDVFFTTSSETPEEVGMSCVMPENKDNIYLNSFCFGYRPTEKFDLDYLAYVLRANYFRKEMTFLAQGISRYNISKNKVMEVSIPVPNLEEQTMIGRYFSNIDRLITLHQRKFYLLLKLLHNDWEQRKLDDVAEFSKGNGYSKGDLIEVGTPIILYGRLYTKYETSISDVDTYVEAKEGSVYSKGGEVIVPASGETAEDIARAATVDKSGILLGGDLNVVMPNKDINSAFMAISISNGNSQRELAKKAQGKSVVHIHNEEIRNLIVPFPNKTEQDKIVDYFTNLDHLITLHHRKYIDTLKAP